MKPKSLSPTCAPTAVRSCFRCGSEFPSSGRDRVCWRCRTPKTSHRTAQNKELTFREKQVVDLVSQGKANKEIAFHLILTEGTIKEYLNQIFRKVRVSNRTELAIWALSHRASAENDAYQSRPDYLSEIAGYSSAPAPALN